MAGRLPNIDTMDTTPASALDQAIPSSGPRARAYRYFGAALLGRALLDSLRKFDLRVQVRNPVMFVVWLGALVTACLTVEPGLFGPSTASRAYNAAVTAILALTVWFANLAEALAEGRGKAHADALRRTRRELVARRITASGETETIPARELRKGDLVRVVRNELIPTDGEVVEGIAYVNELAITGELAPVLKESGTDIFSAVTAGTVVISDQLLVRATTNPGESFLDRMIHLVEGAHRQKTPNEIALTVLLAVLTLIFVIVVAAMAPVAVYLDARINIADLIALLVALIPTTIGALLSAIGIAGIDRTVRFNILAMSGKAVEAAGDVQTLILDKTGTITIGDRRATRFMPLSNWTTRDVARAAYLASFFDTTPEGRSVVAFAEQQDGRPEGGLDGARGLDFSAETGMSGTDMPDGQIIRKGAVNAVIRHVADHFGTSEPDGVRAAADEVARMGATPLAVSMDGAILGVIALSDVLKPGMRDRIARLRAMGIRTIMVTGDNPVTALAITAEAGLDDFVAEAKPEDKLRLIRREQAAGRLVAMTGDGTSRCRCRYALRDRCRQGGGEPDRPRLRSDKADRPRRHRQADADHPRRLDDVLDC